MTVGSGAQITANDAVDLESSSTSDAVGEAIFTSLVDSLRGGSGNSYGFAGGVSYASSDAETTVSSNAVISAGGDVTITSDAESDTNMTAEVSQNAGLKEQYSHPDTVQTALGSTVAKLTSLTTVAAGANVSGLGSVAITATGSKSDTLNVSTASYGDGKVGLTAAVSIDTSDVETHVNGTVTAGTAPAIQSLTFNSSLAVDFATSSIVFGSSPGYTTGQALIYSSGVGGAIPGLVSGQVYYAIVSSSSPNALQLAATKADAESGTFIVFGPAYPTLSAAGLNVPITSVDAPDSEIQFDYDPGFTEGQQVTYTPAAGNFLGYNDSNNNLLGALPAGTYTVHIVNGTSDSNNLYTIQLQKLQRHRGSQRQPALHHARGEDAPGCLLRHEQQHRQLRSGCLDRSGRHPHQR